METVTVREVRLNFRRVLSRRTPVLVTRTGKPVAAVVPVWQLKEWRERRDRFFATIDAVRRKTRKVKPEIIERDVAEAVRKVRARSRRRPA